MTFSRAFELVVREEGNLSLDPKDKGNWTGGRTGKGELRGTKFGISAAAYPHLDIQALTLADAKSIYWTDYWLKINGQNLPFPWGIVVFDCAVNQGVGTAKNLMQNALGVLVDGDLGPKTFQSLESSNLRHFARFMALRALRYVKTLGFLDYGFGWFTRLFIIALEAHKEL